MCGIFGAVVVQPSKRWNEGTIRALTWSNRERGTDSLGFFDSSGKMTKGAGDPSDVLQKPRIKKWLKHSQETSWFISGHSRFATRGKVNRRNSHPFRYGRIIGSHNGMVDAPTKFQVDSEYLFYAINKARGDYQKGLENISGYWGLNWYDGKDFYLLCHSGELAYDIIDGILYYSSSWSHLDSCTGGNSTVMKEGQVIRISSDGTVANSEDTNPAVKPFKSGVSKYWYGSYCGSSYSSHKRNYSTGGRGSSGRKESITWQHDHNVDGYLETNANTARDYDTEWQEAWANYTSESEHSGSDEDYSERYAG